MQDCPTHAETVRVNHVPADRLRAVTHVCTACPPVSTEWLRLAAFAADYYQRGLGEVALPALPQALRDASRWSRLFAPEERYSLTAEGRAALPETLPARASALRKLAQALAEAEFLSAADARAERRRRPVWAKRRESPSARGRRRGRCGNSAKLV